MVAMAENQPDEANAPILLRLEFAQQAAMASFVDPGRQIGRIGYRAHGMTP